MTLANSRNLMRTAGILAWVFAGLPSVRGITVGPYCLAGPQLAVWFVAFGIFGVAFFRATDHIGRPVVEAWAAGLVLVQTAAALTMLSLVCSGFEAVLLIVVAAQLGVLLPMRVGAPWIVLQSSAMGYLVMQHWSSPRAAAYWLLGSIGFQLFAYIIASIAGREAESRRELARANAELRATRELLTMTSKGAERLRISRELHDLVGHDLAALHLNLEAARHLAEGKVLDYVTKAQGVGQQLLDDVRRTVSVLREDQAIDVTKALRTLCEGIDAPAVHLRLPDTLQLADPDRAQALLRCVQEVLTNAIKHSRADNLWIEVERDGEALSVRATDDGRGVDVVSIGNGLLGMRERFEALGGSVAVDSQRGGGFRLLASLPLALGSTS